MISCGTPNRTSACARARHTVRAVARSTTVAITQNREWSSIPVTSLADRISPVVTSTRSIPPTMSMPHSSIGPGRSNRWYALLGFLRGRTRNNPCRIRIRSIVRSAGTTTPGAGLRSSSNRIRRDPHRGCARRISTTHVSTAGTA